MTKGRWFKKAKELTEPPAQKFTHKGYGFFFRDKGDPWADPKIRIKSVATVLDLLEGRLEPSNDEFVLQCVSNVKGLFNRIARGDRPDWFTVASQFGYPSARLCRQVAEDLAKMRKAMVKEDPEAYLSAKARVLAQPVVECLHGFEDAVLRDKWFEAERGWAYVFWSHAEKDILAIGTTEGTIFEVADELNHEFKNGGRYGVIGAWLVHDPDETARLFKKHFDRNSIGAGFYRVEIGDAKKEIQTLLDRHDQFVLSPWHVEEEPELEMENESEMALSGP